MDGKRIGHMTTTTGVGLGGQVLTWVDKSYTPTLAGIGFNSTLFLVINTLLLHILHLVLLLLLSDHLFPQSSHAVCTDRHFCSIFVHQYGFCFEKCCRCWWLICGPCKLFTSLPDLPCSIGTYLIKTVD